jgi:hypothetical protein
MIEHVTSTDAFLYHYTKAATARDLIFENGTLLFGRYAETNDPKETKTWQFDLGTNFNIDLGAYKMDELSTWLSNELKYSARLACFSMDTAQLTGDHLQDIFKRGFCKPRMWAQYAERHSGVCIVFDRQKLTQQVEARLGSSYLVLSGAVRYVDRNIVRNLADQQYMINLDVLESLGREAYADRHLKTHYQRLFFEKMNDWRDESEWRWVVFGNANTDLHLDITGCVAGVMFGENTEEKVIQDIMDKTESWGIRYMGLKWKNCSPWYDYGNLRYMSGIKNSPWGACVRRV